MTTELLSRQAAAEWLAQQFPDKRPDQWALWLRNNANAARPAVYRVAVEQVGRGSFYRQEELERFAVWERSRQTGQLSPRAMEALRAVGFNERGGSSTGRRFDVSSISRQYDEATGTPFVQLMVTNPHLLVYRLPVEQALEIADQLAAEAGGRRQQATYSTVTDNADVVVKRKA